MHISLPADESNQEVTYEIQDDADGLVIAADCNHWVWPVAFHGGIVDPVVGEGISYPSRGSGVLSAKIIIAGFDLQRATLIENLVVREGTNNACRNHEFP